MKKIYIIILTVSFGALAHSEDAQKTPSSEPSVLTLNEVLTLALKNSPSIKAVNADLANRLADAKQIGLLKNPNLEITFPQTLRSNEDPTSPLTTAKLTQPFSLADLGYRQTLSGALKQVATLDAQVEVFRVLNDTTLIYYRGWVLQQRLKALKDVEKQSKQVAGLISKAIEEGTTPSTEGNIFAADAIRFGADAKAVAAEMDLTQAELIRITGQKWDKPTLERPHLTEIPSDIGKLIQFAQSRFNLQERLKLKEEAARKKMNLAHLGAFPEISPQLIYERERNGSKTIGLGVSLPLPLFDWNQAESLRTRGEWEKSKADREALDLVGFESQLMALQKRAIATQERADAYWDKVIPAYAKSYTLGRQMFEMGQANMLQLWQLQKSMVDAQDQALQFTAESIAARTALEGAIGGKVEEIE